ncbi:MAG TPA: hemolysin protein, partial [Planctomycetaceae bacterium]|nr:hemolysin protein [Planctomycetaceae bacterium]
MIAAILITCLGIALSAFFSGSETGFYRVTRVRLEIDAKEGQLVARGLHWLATKANLVVATVLIGNNIANYLVSLGLVLISARILAPDSQLESALPLLMTPVLFIYGELLPKFLFYQAPYRLLRLGAPVMLLCTILFMPVSIFVLLLETISGWLNPRETPGPTASRERQELQRVLVEGQEAGVVLPI